MRILLVQESDWLKRGPHQQHHLIERLIAQGHDIRIIDYEIDWKETTNEGLLSRTKIYKTSSKSIGNQQVIVIRPPLLKAPILSYVSITIFHSIAIIKQIKSFRPDVVVGMGILNAYLTARITKVFGIPFVYYLIDSLHTLIPEKLLRPFGRLLEHKTLKIANQVLAINKHLGQYAKKMGSLIGPEIITAGVDKLRFNPDIDGRPIRRKLEIPENALVIFFMGWLYDFSGLREVSKSILEEKSDVYLLVLGRGDLQKELYSLAAKSGRNLIKIVDWVPYENVPECLAAADVCILPAHLNEIMRDIVPIKLYEYLACGKPVIATKLPGVMSEFGKNSGIVYVDCPEETIARVKEIWSNSKLLSKLKEDALEFSNSLDWDQITSIFLTLLQSLKQKKSNSGSDIL